MTNTSKLKYSLKDVQVLVDTFYDLISKGAKNITSEDISPLLDYPEEDIQKFLETVLMFDIDQLTKENYYGYMGLILIRMNL